MWAGLSRLARLAITGWALFGGLVLIALVALTATSAILNLAINRPILGDFELVKHGVAIAAFAFLPYTQLTYGNVTVDIFTERMSARSKALMLVVSSLIAAAVAALLFRQMWLGMLDYMRYREVMVSLPIPLWTAFPPALFSLCLLVVAAVLTALEGVRAMRTGLLPTVEPQE